MNVWEYEDKFFEIAKKMGFEIEICKAGKFKGERQLDFGNKKLHAGHIRKLYQIVKDKGPKISDRDLEKVAPGRPCAVPYFNMINKKVFSGKNLTQ